MGCSSSKTPETVVSPQAAQPAAPAVEPGGPSVRIKNKDVATAEPDFKTIHSAIRWKKPVSEIRKLITNEAALNIEDPMNGNRPLHIAAQNGHQELVEYLVKFRANVNAKNNKGNTPLHMAVSYDYYGCSKCLLDGGADPKIANNAGNDAIRGIEGDKCLGVVALQCATNANEVHNALRMCEEDRSHVDKANFAQAGLKCKKAMAEAWTEDIQGKFKEFLLSL